MIDASRVKSFFGQSTMALSALPSGRMPWQYFLNNKLFVDWPATLTSKTSA